MSRALYNVNVEPKCKYCFYGIDAADGKMVLCKKKGVFEPDHSCNKYRYDPLKRQPDKPAKLQSFTDDDFSI